MELGDPAVYLVHVEVCISREVLTHRGLGITKSTIKSRATDTDHYGNQTKKEEKQAGISTSNICRNKRHKNSLKIIDIITSL